jgi:pimeloyl-ACP methyl ester carboxylesterase
LRQISGNGLEFVRDLVQEPRRRRHSRRALLEALRALEESWPGFYERAFWRQEIKKLEAPVLLLWGRWDSLNPPSRALAMLKMFHDAYLFQEEECGHWPCLEPAWAALKIGNLSSGSANPKARRFGKQPLENLFAMMRRWI